MSKHGTLQRAVASLPGIVAVAMRVVLVAGLLIAPKSAEAAEADPRVPPGLDPGGPAIALITDGIDYTLPEIASRLARDGEGEAIALDLVDGDVRPHAGPDSQGTRLARAFLSEHPTARLIIARVAAPDGMQIARAAAFLVQTPAKVIAIAPAPPDGAVPFIEQIATAHAGKAIVASPEWPQSQAGSVIASGHYRTTLGHPLDTKDGVPFARVIAHVACWIDKGMPPTDIKHRLGSDTICDPSGGETAGEINKTQF